MKIEIEQFRSWQKDPVTVEAFKALTVMRDYYQSLLRDHTFLLSEKAQQEIPLYIGRIEAYDDILDLDLETLQEEKNDGD